MQVKNSGESYGRRQPINQSRNFTKAEILIENRNGGKIVLKDYRNRNFLIRSLYGRFTLKKEAKAYTRLNGLNGFPRCFGFEENYALILEYVNGKPLSSFTRGKVPESVFFKLEKILSSMHSKGVVNCDLHRSNVLLTPDWDVYLIDFASAVFTETADNPGFFFRGLRDLDIYSCERMKSRYLYLEAPVPKGFFGACYNFVIKIKRRLKKRNRLKKRQKRRQERLNSLNCKKS